MESLLNPKKVKKKPLEIFLISVIYSLLAVFFSYSLFPEQSSILTISFITILFVPFFQKIFEIEEHEEDEYIEHKKQTKNKTILTRHKDVISIYSAFFLGVVVTLTIVFIFLPQFGNIFELQLTNMPTANIIKPLNPSNNAFSIYFLNNTRVLILCFIFSVLFGTGAVLILAWNASIISVFLGVKFINPLIEKGIGSLPAFAHGLSSGLLSIASHGIPEIMAYFIAGLGGGILSVALIREELGTKDFNNILKDAVKFILIAETLIVFAAIIEAIQFSFFVNIILIITEISLFILFMSSGKINLTS